MKISGTFQSDDYRIHRDCGDYVPNRRIPPPTWESLKERAERQDLMISYMAERLHGRSIVSTERQVEREVLRRIEDKVLERLLRLEKQAGREKETAVMQRLENLLFDRVRNQIRKRPSAESIQLESVDLESFSENNLAALGMAFV